MTARVKCAKKPSVCARALAVAGLSAGCAVSMCSARPSHASDANHVHAFVLGAGEALANSEWLDASNEGRARVHFPRTPSVLFRVRLPGGIGQAPASDAAGNLFIVHGEPRLSKLDALGHTLWTKRLESEATSAPVLTADGSLLLTTHDSDALLFKPSGQLRRKTALPFAEPRHRTLAIPLSNGGALIASGSDVIELDAGGELVRQSQTPANVTGIAEGSASLLAVCENGAIARARISGDFEVIGNLGGAAPEGGAVQGDRLFAVVDAHRLVAFDLSAARVVTVASDTGVTLSGPPLLLENHSSVVIADGGFLSLRAANGGEALRLSIAQARAFDPATRALRAALAIADAESSIAAVRSGSDALILAVDGKAQRIEGTSCLDPFRPTPTKAGVIFACRSGQLFGVSDRAP